MMLAYSYSYLSMSKRETIWLGWLDFLEHSRNFGLLVFNSGCLVLVWRVATIITTALMLSSFRSLCMCVSFIFTRPRLMAQEVES
jgi:hypothetical protein